MSNSAKADKGAKTIHIQNPSAYAAWLERMQKVDFTQRSADLFAHQIFYAESFGSRRVRPDAASRATLPPDARKRWDFFFKPDPTAVYEIDSETMAQIRKKHSQRKGLRRTAYVASGLVALACLIVLALAKDEIEQLWLGAVALIGLAAVVWIFLLFTGRELTEKEAAVEKFRQDFDKQIDEHAASRPTVRQMFAHLHGLVAEEAKEAAPKAGANAGEPLAVYGWAVVGEAARFVGEQIPRRRYFARAGGMFAVYDVGMAVPAGDRIYLRRSLIDVIEGQRYLIEERFLRTDALEIGAVARRNMELAFPPPPHEPSSSLLAKVAPSPADSAPPDGAPDVSDLTMRELLVATAADSHSAPMVEATLLRSLLHTQTRLLHSREALLEHIRKRLGRPATPPAGSQAPSSLDVLSHARLAELAEVVELEVGRLTRDVGELEESIDILRVDAPFDKLRDTLFSNEAPELLLEDQRARQIASTPSRTPVAYSGTIDASSDEALSKTLRGPAGSPAEKAKQPPKVVVRTPQKVSGGQSMTHTKGRRPPEPEKPQEKAQKDEPLTLKKPQKPTKP